jgi:hypothetical protein
MVGERGSECFPCYIKKQNKTVHGALREPQSVVSPLKKGVGRVEPDFGILPLVLTEPFVFLMYWCS